MIDGAVHTGLVFMIDSENMDEPLHQARCTELDRSERVDRATLERLLRIRVEIKACTTEIHVLVRERAPAVNCLLAELLSSIFMYILPSEYSFGVIAEAC